MAILLRQMASAWGGLGTGGSRLAVNSRENISRLSIVCAEQSRRRTVNRRVSVSTTKDTSLQRQRGWQAKRRTCDRELDSTGLVITNYQELSAEEITRLRQIFEMELELVLTPWAVDAGRPFPNIRDGAVNIAVVVRQPQTEANKLAIVSVPDCVERWIKVPKLEASPSQPEFVCIEEVIVNNLDLLFGGMDILLTHMFQVTSTISDNMYNLCKDQADIGSSHLILHVDDTMPLELTEVLADELNVDCKNDVLRINGPLPFVGAELLLPMLSVSRTLPM